MSLVGGTCSLQRRRLCEVVNLTCMGSGVVWRAVQVAAEGDFADAVESLLEWARRTSALADAPSADGVPLGPGIGSGSRDAAAAAGEESDSDSEAPAAGRGSRGTALGLAEGLEAAAAPLVAAAERCCRAGAGAPKQLSQVTHYSEVSLPTPEVRSGVAYCPTCCQPLFTIQIY